MPKPVYPVSNFFDVRLIMSEVAATTNTQLSAAMGRWAKTMDKQVTTAREKDLKRIHKETALLAQEAVLSAYQASGIGTEFPSYRQRDTGKLRRYSGGAMERAMRNKSFIMGDSRSIRFVDQDLMDREAKQWYRLNFGAAPRGSKNPSVGSMRFFGKASSQRAELVGFPPSKGFRLPQGATPAFASSTFSATSRGEFTVSRGKSRGAIYIRTRGQKFTGKVPPKFLRGVPTRGIEGKRFLDAGARSINENYPRLLTAMIRRWEDTARKSMK